MQIQIPDLWKGMDGLPEGHNADSNHKQARKCARAKGALALLNGNGFTGPARGAPDDIVGRVGMRLRQADTLPTSILQLIVLYLN